jgi:hypothetical protein
VKATVKANPSTIVRQISIQIIPSFPGRRAHRTTRREMLLSKSSPEGLDAPWAVALLPSGRF